MTALTLVVSLFMGWPVIPKIDTFDDRFPRPHEQMRQMAPAPQQEYKYGDKGYLIGRCDEFFVCKWERGHV